MPLFNTIATMGHEQVLLCYESESDYRSVIAIHNTQLGPAVGGTRLWHYTSYEDAFIDALRLSRGMTYKSALAGLPAGGGRAIILRGQQPLDRVRLFRAHGRFVETLGGRFITAEDVGTTLADMEVIAQQTRHVAGLASGGGDPSPWTAKGVFRAMEAALQHRFGQRDMTNRTVALQGCGHVGYQLAKLLSASGAALVVTDIQPAHAERVAKEFNATIVDPDAIWQVDADIFAPCALGGIINDDTIPQLKVAIVAGAANNQLLKDHHGQVLKNKDILYVPDYAANAGDILSGGVDLFGWDTKKVVVQVNGIYDTVLSILQIAKSDDLATSVVADRLAEQRLSENARKQVI